jgi:hypothetical protein
MSARDVHVGDAVAVGETEVAVVHVSEHSPEPSTGHRLVAGVDESYSPRLRRALVDLHLVPRDVEGDVAHMKEVIREVFPDEIALVAEAEHEVVDPVGGVALHDVPENRFPTDLDHRFRPEMGLLAESRANPAREYDCLHDDLARAGIRNASLSLSLLSESVADENRR